MNRTLILILLLLFSVSAGAEEKVKASEMIPRPVFCLDKEGQFMIRDGLTLSAPVDFSSAASLLNEEGYELDISPEKISIKAFSTNGALNAVFSLMQLQLLQSDRSLLPCAQIKDEPRFSYRGMHLDVSRHF